VAVPFTLIGWAEEHIESGTASVLNSSMPLFTALFAAVVLMEERFTAARAAGLTLGFLGVAVLTGGGVSDLGDSSLLGSLAMIGAAACYGAAAVFARTLLRQHDPLGLSGAQLAVGSLLLLPAVFATDGVPDYSLSVEAWLSLLALGVAGTGIGVAMYMWLIDNVGSVRSSLVTYVVPVVGLFLGWAVLDESIGAHTIVGFVLIIAGVAAVMRGQAPSRQRLPLAAEAAPAE
jgi:drug/metabolite transporter (DMT)-like permease